MAELKYPKDIQKIVDADQNRDPLSGEAGAHPVGVGIGAAAAGAAIGAAVGSLAVLLLWLGRRHAGWSIEHLAHRGAQVILRNG